MNVELRIAQSLWLEMHRDLDRRHPFAFERVGFLTTAKVSESPTEARLVASRWQSVADEDYLRDDKVGASIGSEAFRKILQSAYFGKLGVLHVHRHHHRGRPVFSWTDHRSMKSFIPSFFNAQASQFHGALLLSLDSVVGVVRSTSNGHDLPINRIVLSRTEV